jgi:hypothetical protein
MKKVYIIVFSLFALHAGVSGQTQQECQDLFKKATDKVRSLRMMSARNAFEMTASMVATPEKGAVVQERMEVVMQGDKYKYKTNQFSLYQDKKTTVVVQKDRKSVFLTNAVSEDRRKDQFAEMMKLQDSLQEHLLLRECAREFGTVLPGVGFTKVVFVPTKKLEGLGLRSIAYWIDATAVEVKKITLEYTPGSAYGMKRYELIIEKMNAQSKTVPFPGDAAGQVMQGGKLKGDVKDYELIDKRN